MKRCCQAPHSGMQRLSCLGAAQLLQPVPVPELDITWQDAERREERRWPVQHTSPGASTRHALGALIGMH